LVQSSLALNFIFPLCYKQTTAVWSYDWGDLHKYFDLYHDLIAHWHKTYPGFILDFPYEDLVADPKGQAEKLLEFCELEWEDAVLEFSKNVRAIQTHSINQVNKPLYKTAVGAWLFYEEYIGPQLEHPTDNSNTDGPESQSNKHDEL